MALESRFDSRARSRLCSEIRALRSLLVVIFLVSS
jgi:hypothetical protein